MLILSCTHHFYGIEGVTTCLAGNKIDNTAACTARFCWLTASVRLLSKLSPYVHSWMEFFYWFF